MLPRANPSITHAIAKKTVRAALAPRKSNSIVSKTNTKCSKRAQKRGTRNRKALGLVCSALPTPTIQYCMGNQFQLGIEFVRHVIEQTQIGARITIPMRALNGWWGTLLLAEIMCRRFKRITSTCNQRSFVLTRGCMVAGDNNGVNGPVQIYISR